MAYLEGPDFIPAHEYNKFRQERITAETDLIVGEVYTAMLRFRGGGTGLEAAKLPSRFHGLIEESGHLAVHFALVDEDLIDGAHGSARFMDGFLRSITGIEGWRYGRRRRLVTIAEGYFRSYFDDSFGQFMIEQESLKVPALA